MVAHHEPPARGNFVIPEHRARYVSRMPMLPVGIGHRNN
jgi:hypothetical protein